MTRRAAVLLALAIAARPALGQQPPQFQTGVEVLPIDVTVVDNRGRPIDDLAPSDFTVRVDGQPRRVVSAQWIPRLTAVSPSPAIPAAAASEGYVSNAEAAGSGLVVIAVDEANIPFGGMRPMAPAVTRFIDRLPAADRISIVSFGLGRTAWSDFTADRGVIKEKLSAMAGQQFANAPPWSHHVGIGAALAHVRGELDALREVIQRACGGAQNVASVRTRNALDCPTEVRTEAMQVAEHALRNADLTLGGLRELLQALRTVDAPKTLLLISDGFALDRTSGPRWVAELGELAAASRTTIYSLKLEEQPTDITQQVARAPFEVQQDQMERRQGLETLSMAARGAIFTLTGTGTGAFDRIESELSGSYLLGVEPGVRDREPTPRPIQIAVGRSGATVRSRRTMTADWPAKPQSPEDRVNAALSNPLMLSALPLRGIAFAMRGPDPSKLQLLIHADIGAEYTSARTLSVAHVVLDAQKRAIDGQMSEQRLTPPGGLPSPVQYARTVAVDPGDYTVKIAAADGDLIGSIELPVRAALTRAGALDFTELMVGGPSPPVTLVRPTIGPQVRFGIVQGYLEAYGRGATALTARFEIATADQAPPVFTVDVPPRVASDERVVFTQTVSVGELPPGEYRLRVVVGGEGGVTKSRAFEIPAPPPVATSASSVFLPLNASDLARPFRLDDALRPSVVQTFRLRLQAGVAATFEEALTHLHNRVYLESATAFERAAQGGGDPTAPLVYLGVCFAATGHDNEALAAWRRAVANTGDVPELHEWLIDALMRTKSYGEARTTAERARQQWPSDTRFTRPIALLDATAGRARDAVTGMERYVSDRPDDEAALFLTLKWLFTAKRAGLVVHDRDRDATLARAYAQQYSAIQGASQPLVNLWVDYLERIDR
jgi:VWFA-related protein